jgi:hypothetical protein
MERTSPNYNDPQFTKKPEDSLLDKYDKGFDKALNTADKVYSVGRKIGYIFMGLFFLFIGGGLTVWGIFNYQSRIDELNSFEQINGTVIKMREVESNDNSGVTYAPIIGYSVNGKKFVHESGHSSDPPAYKVGDKVAMRYNAKDPDDVFIDTFWGKWWGTITLAICVAVFFPLGIWMLFSAFRRNKPAKQQDYYSNSGGPSGSSYVSIG